MDKRKALVTLIQNCFSLPDEAKLVFLGKVETFTDDEVDTLGTYFARERTFVLQNETSLKSSLGEVLEMLEDQTKPEE